MENLHGYTAGKKSSLPSALRRSQRIPTARIHKMGCKLAGGRVYFNPDDAGRNAKWSRGAMLDSALREFGPLGSAELAPPLVSDRETAWSSRHPALSLRPR